MKRKRKKRVIYDVKHLRFHASRRQNGKCFWCGETMNSIPNHALELTADHHPIPRYAGGKTEPGNIVASCRRCNNSRCTETNKRKKREGRLVASAGNMQVRSPFEVLKR